MSRFADKIDRFDAADIPDAGLPGHRGTHQCPHDRRGAVNGRRNGYIRTRAAGDGTGKCRRSVAALQSDLAGKLYVEFDPHDPERCIPAKLTKWVEDNGIIVSTRK